MLQGDRACQRKEGKNMKAALFNGSPRRNGSTAALLACIGRTLEANGWEVETVHLGKASIHRYRGYQA